MPLHAFSETTGNTHYRIGQEIAGCKPEVDKRMSDFVVRFSKENTSASHCFMNSDAAHIFIE